LLNAIQIAQKELKFICQEMKKFVDKYKKDTISATISLPSDDLLEKAQKLAYEYEDKFFPTNKKDF
jgi:hypothetical protein